MTMLIAGHETTAAVLTWTVYCLLQNPEFMPRLQAEVTQLCCSRVKCMQPSLVLKNLFKTGIEGWDNFQASTLKHEP